MNPGANKVLRYLLLVVVGGGVAVALALFQEHISSFFSQQGWNGGAAEETVRSFARQAWEKGSGDKAASMLDQTAFEPVVKDGRFVSVWQGENMGRRNVPLKELAPSKDLKTVKAELLARDGGSFRVVAQFPNGKWGEYRVRRANGELRIIRLPDYLFDKEPPRSSRDY